MSNTARRNCQLYLVIEMHAAARDHLAAILAGAPIASVLFRPGRAAPLNAHALKPLVELVQKAGAAALILDDVALARTLRADGVHLSASAHVMAHYAEARSILGAGAIVGGDAGGSRHVAMELGEAGAEYVAFGTVVIPAEAPVDHAAAEAAIEDAPADLLGPLSQHELIAWWSEVFEVPCVAFDVADAAGACDAAMAGADFAALTCPFAISPGAAADWVRSIRHVLEHADA